MHEVVERVRITLVRNAEHVFITPKESDPLTNGDRWTWEPLTYHMYGVCYALQFGKELVSGKILDVKITGLMPFYLVMHHQGC